MVKVANGTLFSNENIGLKPDYLQQSPLFSALPGVSLNDGFPYITTGPALDRRLPVEQDLNHHH
jgi:hypothetical protein